MILKRKLLVLGVLLCLAAACAVPAAAEEITLSAVSDRAENLSGEAVDNSTVSDYTDMFRLYNYRSGEHFYTGDINELNSLTAAGWSYEGIGWRAPLTGEPVYRMYNSFAGDHHYTMNAAERDMLVNAGWNYEGIGWYSGGSVPLYRQYNPNASTGAHNYTTSAAERDALVAAGWSDEGIGWYGTDLGEPYVPSETSATENRKLILVGDSRTVGMCNAKTGSSYVTENVLYTCADGTIFSCQGGKRYYEMRDYLVPQIEGAIDASTDIVILMGVNDCWNGGIQEETLPQYISFINRKAAEWKAKGARTFFCSVLPVRNEYYLGAYTLNNALICRFNEYMKTNLSEDVEYIDLYSEMLGNMEFADAVHFTAKTNLDWYNAIVEKTRPSVMVIREVSRVNRLG